MDQTHLHLLINHLAIIGSILGGLVLLYGLLVKSNETKIAAFGLLIISSVAAVIAYITGEAAEETVEHISGISESMIELHEDFAIAALWALIILGVVSSVALYLTLKRSPSAGKISWLTFFICVISSVLIARTGYLGGQIRHTEINPGATMQQENANGNESEKSEEGKHEEN